MLSPRRKALEHAVEVLTDYLLENCPDEVFWEDFDPDIDGIRTTIQEVMENDT